MADLNKLSPAALKAAMQGGTELWGKYGSARDHVRYLEPFKSRKKCRCGCNGPVTHLGKANGVALTSGCEMHVRRWVKGLR